MEQRKGRRLILFPLPLQGHINPMLELANILHLKGFSITIIHTNFNSLNPSSHPHFTFHSIPDGLSETEASTKDILTLIFLLNAKCVEPFRKCLASLLSDDSGEPVACLISDAIFHFAQSVADGLKVPRVVLRTGGATSFTVFAAFSLLREKGYIPIKDSQSEEPVVEFPPLRVKDLPMLNRYDSDTCQLVDDMSNGTKTSRGLIFNTFEDLEEHALEILRQDFPNPIFPIGPFHKCFPAASSSHTLSTEDKSCISWLNSQAPKSVVYVSFGSLAVIKEDQLLEIAWGLANSRQPFLWAIRHESIHGGSKWLELLPSEYLENLNGRGHIVKWSRQKEVLAHTAIGAFWTHSGWNSTLESICEGVPMICMPCFTDQMVNARYVSNVWKVGLQLEHGVERGEVERIIRRLVVEKEGEEIRARSLELMKKANLCFKQDGSSQQSLDCLVKHILTLESFVFRTQ